MCPKRNRRGREEIFDEECIAQPAGVRRGCGDVAGGQGKGMRKCSGRACRCAGAGDGLRRGMGGGVGGRASAPRGRACRCRGAGADLRRRMGREGGGFNALSPQRLARTRIIIYVRRATAVKSRPWGRKGAPANAHRPRRLPHPPRPRLHFRAVVHTSPAKPSAAPTKISASRSSSYPQWVIHGKVIHIVARRPVQNVLALAPAHANI